VKVFYSSISPLLLKNLTFTVIYPSLPSLL
jgi:hypothetical protein